MRLARKTQEPITTPRLTLRRFRDADAPALARAVNDIDIARMAARIPHPYPGEVAEGWILLQAPDARRELAHTFALEDRAGALVGSIGAFRPETRFDWEIGYWIAKPHWGQGYASEALTGLMGWLAHAKGARRVTAGHFADNPASARVLAKAGFRPTGEITVMYSLGRGARVNCVEHVWTTEGEEDGEGDDPGQARARHAPAHA